MKPTFDSMEERFMPTGMNLATAIPEEKIVALKNPSWIGAIGSGLATAAINNVGEIDDKGRFIPLIIK